MDEKNKLRIRLRIAGNIVKIAILFVIIAVSIFLVWARLAPKTGSSENETKTVSMYFRDSVSYVWEIEMRQIKVGSDKEMVDAVISELRSGPKSSLLLRSIPEYVSTSDVRMITTESEDGTPEKFIEISFTESYGEMSAAEASDCIGSIVYTLTELDFINGVQFSINGETLLYPDGTAIGRLNRENVVLEPTFKEKPVIQKATLYFMDEQGLGLVAEEREIEREVNQPIENEILKAMVKGPATEGLYAVIPAGTSVISTWINDVTCFVDLTSDFVDKLDAGSTMARLAIASIVNALTEAQTNVKLVQILIEGDKVTSPLPSGIDISKPFERMEDEIIK